MKLRLLFLILATVGLAVLCLFSKSEVTFELDGANYRPRECSRSRSWLFGFVLWREAHILPPLSSVIPFHPQPIGNCD